MHEDLRDPPPRTTDVVRRGTVTTNPRVGARGRRTQQRLLAAALDAFGERGYHACSVERITARARCSRVSFYQYFASKEDVYRTLVDEIATEVRSATEALGPLTSDAAGWRDLRTWVGRFGEIHARYEPVFHVARLDDALTDAARRIGSSTVDRVCERIASPTLPGDRLAPTLRLLLACVSHTFGVVGILRAAAPPDPGGNERTEVAITDVLHRTLFGTRDDVNVHPPGPPLPALELGPDMIAMLGPYEPMDERSPSTRRALLDAGRTVFLERGFHPVRVDDIVAAAGVSHGAFYEHFRSREALAQELTGRALQAMGSAVGDAPDPVSTRRDAASLRSWLQRYHAAQTHEAAMLRVWIQATLQAPPLRADFAPLHDWGRRRMARFLRPRGFGDVEVDANVMMALLGAFGCFHATDRAIDVTASVVERGLLGS